MKKVLLVNTNTEKSPYPVPPLGLCLLSAMLEKKYEVKIFDGVFNEGMGLVRLVLDFQPDFIGFSIRNIDDVVIDRPVFYVDEILEKFIFPVKAIARVPMILGGSGFSIFPEELMRLTGVQYGILGEAEKSFPDLLDALVNGTDVTHIPNIVVQGRKHLQTGFAFPEFKPFSLHSELDQRLDFNPYRPRGVYSVQTKRGCSHGCIYCTYPLIEGKHYRLRDPEDIADEIEQAYRRIGNIMFEFVDSTFNDPVGHAEEICRAIIRRKIKVRLRTMGINPRHCSDELFALMIKAGFVQIDATPDSASPQILKNLRKGFALREVEKMARLILKHHLPTMWFFLFGGPGEDVSTFKETLDFIDAYVSPDDMVYMTAGLRVYPNTPLHKIAIREGMIHKEQSIFRDPFYYFSEKLPKFQLDQMILEATLQRHHCIPARETTPPVGMVKEALSLREKEHIDEPMFRTLIRIRKAWKEAGKV